MNPNFKTLNLLKSGDSERASYKNRDCETHITAKKMRLRDLWNLTKKIRDPEFLKDHSPPLLLFLYSTIKLQFANWPWLMENCSLKFWFELKTLWPVKLLSATLYWQSGGTLSLCPRCPLCKNDITCFDCF